MKDYETHSRKTQAKREWKLVEISPVLRKTSVCIERLDGVICCKDCIKNCHGSIKWNIDWKKLEQNNQTV